MRSNLLAAVRLAVAEKRPYLVIMQPCPHERLSACDVTPHINQPFPLCHGRLIFHCRANQCQQLQHGRTGHCRRRGSRSSQRLQRQRLGASCLLGSRQGHRNCDSHSRGQCPGGSGACLAGSIACTHACCRAAHRARQTMQRMLLCCWCKAAQPLVQRPAADCLLCPSAACRSRSSAPAKPAGVARPPPRRPQVRGFPWFHNYIKVP